MLRSARETAWVGVRFSRRSGDRGGNPLGCACGIRGPPRYGERRTARVPRRARACPSLCCDREGNGVGWRAVFAQIGRSRGTGPRATVKGEPPAYPVGRWENLSLAMPRASQRSRGTGPRATGSPGASRLAGDRPPRYGKTGGITAHGGQAPALRKNRGIGECG